MPSSPRIADAACSLSPRPRASAPSPQRSQRRRERRRPRRPARAPHHRDGALPEQLPRVRAQGPRRAAEVAHGGVPRRPAEAAAAADAARRRRPRLPARQRRRRRGDGAGGDLDRPRQHAGPGRRRQHPHRPDLLRARVAVRLRRPEAPRCRRGWRSPSCRTSTPCVVSHNHYDHLDEASVQALAAQAGGPPLFVVPLGLKAWLADVGITQRRRARLVAERAASARSRSC